jgi:HTH-type transcriptional repressor of NAD biosynthesis genes
MQKGLVLGKFMPLHKGHIELINFAAQNCDHLIVWVCVSTKEEMPAELRLNWIKKAFESNPNIEPILFVYDEKDLPNSSVSSPDISKKWTMAIKKHLPPINLFFSTEKYGDYVAEYLKIRHILFPENKMISATEIRNKPYKYWDFIPDIVKPYYYKKICILGTESTGKSTLTKQLAEYFDGDYVTEAGREIVEKSNQCTFEDLQKIAISHAKQIQNTENQLNKIAFIDTDINITKSYSKFLFNKELHTEDWIINANQCHHYLYLDKDAPYIQDGTRLKENHRNTLDSFHKNELKKAGIRYKLINGNWEERLKKAVEEIKSLLQI